MPSNGNEIARAAAGDLRELHRRSGTERRLSISAQTPPTGDGDVVLHTVIAKIDSITRCIQVGTTLSIMNVDGLRCVREDLIARAEVGEKKYGTKLRINNGRRAIVDLYQEVLDAIMYSAQGRIEGDATGAKAGIYVELLLGIAAQIAAVLDKE